MGRHGGLRAERWNAEKIGVWAGGSQDGLGPYTVVCRDDTPVAARDSRSAARTSSELDEPLPLALMAHERPLDGFQKLLLPEGFEEELDGAALHRLHRHRNVVVASDQDHRDVVTRRDERLGDDMEPR